MIYSMMELRRIGPTALPAACGFLDRVPVPSALRQSALQVCYGRPRPPSLQTSPCKIPCDERCGRRRRRRQTGAHRLCDTRGKSARECQWWEDKAHDNTSLRAQGCGTHQCSECPAPNAGSTPGHPPRTQPYAAGDTRHRGRRSSTQEAAPLAQKESNSAGSCFRTDHLVHVHDSAGSADCRFETCSPRCRRKMFLARE